MPRSRRSGQTGFSLYRHDREENPAAQGIRGFDRHPPLIGPGALRRYGVCRWWQGEAFGCSLRADGRVSLEGTIRVRADRCCEERITITTKVTTCEPNWDEVHAASLQVAELFDGLPRGC